MTIKMANFTSKFSMSVRFLRKILMLYVMKAGENGSFVNFFAFWSIFLSENRLWGLRFELFLGLKPDFLKILFNLY